MAKTSLIISTYNWPEALDLCLKSVLYQVIIPDEIIVADDGSGDNTKRVVQRFSQNINVPVKHVWQKDEGFRLARIRNLAIQASENEYLIFIDGDIILHPMFIKDHVENRKAEQFITGSRVLMPENETTMRLKSGDIKFEFLSFTAKNKLNGIRNQVLSQIFSRYDKRIYNVRGCNMSFWKNDLIEINGFDEQYTGWGKEDSDIVYRLIESGKKKRKLKFAAVQYHLFHKSNDRSSLLKNDHILNETISSKRTHARVGLIELP